MAADPREAGPLRASSFGSSGLSVARAYVAEGEPVLLVARAAQLPEKASCCWTTRPLEELHLERSPVSKSSLKTTSCGVVTEAGALAGEVFPAASTAVTVYE